MSSLSLGLGLTSIPVLTRRGFNPAASLFGAGEQGGLWNISLMSSLYQDSAGTTPVTAVEQPVGLVIDQSQGGGLGSQLVPTTYSGTVSAPWAISATQITRNGGAAGSAATLTLSSSLSTSKRYRVAFTVSNLSGDTFFYRLGASGTAYQISANGAYSAIVPAGATTASLYFAPWAGTAGEATITLISVQEIPGNHLIQATSASRPTYSARYNLLTYSDTPSNAIWAKDRVSVSGNTISVDAVSYSGITQSSAYVVGTSYTWLISLTAGTVAQAELYFGGSGNVSTSTSVVSGPGSIEAAGSNNVTVTGLTATPTVFKVVWTETIGSHEIKVYPGNWASQTIGNSIILNYADVRRTIDTVGQPAYQRVTTSTDYDTTGFYPYLRCDGADDSLYSSAAIDFTATDEMTVLAGLTTFGGNGMVLETSIDAAANNGAVALYDNNSNTRFDWWSRGTVLAQRSASRTAPVTQVLAGLSKIASDQLVIRSNGVQGGSSSSDQGTGTYGNHLLYVGRRANSSLPFNGRIYSLIVRGATTSGTTLTNTERWIAQRMPGNLIA